MKLIIKKIINKLIKKKISFSVAESCTGGLISHYITSVSGSSKIFDMGLITYSNKSKIKILKVHNEIINKYGAVSEQCCKSMVKNLSKISKSKISLSITGIAGPSGGTKKKPVGLVYIGIIKDKKIIINKHLFKYTNRKAVQKSATFQAFRLNSSFIK